MGMSDNFRVNNPGVQEAHDRLDFLTAQAGRVVEDLNRYLAQMPNATENSGMWPWSDLQNDWNRAYSDMRIELGVIHAGSVGAHNCYKDGDAQSVRIMS
jgi:hypothetical protein